MAKAALRAEEEELAKKRGDTVSHKFADEDLKCKKIYILYIYCIL